MTDTLLAPPVPRVRPAVDGRPPSHRWPERAVAPAAQPALAVGQPALLDAPVAVDPAEPTSIGVRTHLVVHPWAARPTPGLPDARGWSVALSRAIVEALQGRRPLGQLTRWVDEPVLASISLNRRRRRTTAPPNPVQVWSVRVQHPRPTVAEVSAHLRSGRRSSAIAFRLEAVSGRWLCTALELGPTARS